MRAPEQTIAVTPTPPEAQVTDATNVNPGPIPDALREGETAAPDAVMSFAALGARIVQMEANIGEIKAEKEAYWEHLQIANAQLKTANETIALTGERMAQITAAEADGNAVIYIAPDCVPWLKATVHEAKHGYTTPQQYAAAQSIEAQCDAITGA